MSKKQKNTYERAKRQKEIERKKKKELKRQSKLEKNNETGDETTEDANPDS